MVVAIDVTEDNQGLIKEIRTFKELFNVDIDLVYVDTGILNLSDAEIKEGLYSYIKQYSIDCDTTIIKSSEIEPAILQFADEVAADLIMLSTHGRHGLNYLMKGSIAGNLVNHSDRIIITTNFQSV